MSSAPQDSLQNKVQALMQRRQSGALSGADFDADLLRLMGESVPGQPTPPSYEGTAFAYSAGEAVGHTARPFRLINRLGEGTFGVVWSATDLSQIVNARREVALKLLHPSFTHSEEHVRLLMTEATRAQELRHPNIVRVYEWYRDDLSIIGRSASGASGKSSALGDANIGAYFIAMERLHGRTLRQALAAREGQPFTVDETCAIVSAVAAGLQYAFDNFKLLHRDVKAENVFLTVDGTVKLLDFGISDVAESTRATFTQTERTQIANALAAEAVGRDKPVNIASGASTLSHLAPECTANHREGPERDGYALAVLAYHLLDGQKLPFRAVRSHAEPDQPTQLHRPSASERCNSYQRDRVWDALTKGFAYDQRQRTASAWAFAETLKAASVAQQWQDNPPAWYVGLKGLPKRFSTSMLHGAGFVAGCAVGLVVKASDVLRRISPRRWFIGAAIAASVATVAIVRPDVTSLHAAVVNMGERLAALAAKSPTPTTHAGEPLPMPTTTFAQESAPAALASTASTPVPPPGPPPVAVIAARYAELRADIVKSKYWKTGKGALPDGFAEWRKTLDLLDRDGSVPAKIDLARVMLQGFGEPVDELAAAAKMAETLADPVVMETALTLRFAFIDEALVRAYRRPGTPPDSARFLAAIAPLNVYPKAFWQGMVAKCSEPKRLDEANALFTTYSAALPSAGPNESYRVAAREEIAEIKAKKTKCTAD